MKEEPESRDTSGAAQEIERISEALRTAIRLSDVSNRRIERELHMSTGYLTRILAGYVELRMSHVLGICRAIGLPPGNFFTALFPSRNEAGPQMARGQAELRSEPTKKSDPELLVQELRKSFDRLEAFLNERSESA